MEASELLRSVGPIWVLWLTGCLALSLWTGRILRGFTWRSLLGLWRDERGAAYSLSYVMTIPFYMIFVCLVVDSTFLLVAKLGTVQAAYAGARSRIVWSSSAEPSEARFQMERAARQAMIPFACGTASGDKNINASTASAYHRELLEAYQSRTTRAHSTRYFLAKCDYAATMGVTSDIASTAGPAVEDADIKVTVDYRYRFNVPIIGQILGTRGADGAYYYPIRSSIALQNEDPRNTEQSLGIRYASPN